MASGGDAIYKPVQVALYSEEINISEPCDLSCPIIDWAVVAFVDENELSGSQIAKFFDWLVKRLRRQAKLIGSMLNFGDKPKTIWYSDQTYPAAKHVYIDLMQSFRSLSVIFHILPTVETPIYDWVKNITYKLNVCRQGVIADNVRTFFEAADAPLAEIIPNMANNILQRSQQARTNDLRYNSESFQISRPNSTFMCPNATNRAKSVMLFDAEELPSGPYEQWNAPGLMRRNSLPPPMMMPSTSYAMMAVPLPPLAPPMPMLDNDGFQIPSLPPPVMPRQRNTDVFGGGTNRMRKNPLPFGSPPQNGFKSRRDVQRFAQHQHPVRFNPMSTNRPAQRQARRASLPAIPEDIFDDDDVEDDQELDTVIPLNSMRWGYGKLGPRPRGGRSRGFYRSRFGMRRYNNAGGNAVMQRVINERMKDMDIQRHQRGGYASGRSRGAFVRPQIIVAAAEGSSGFRNGFDNPEAEHKPDLRAIYNGENIIERAALICNYPNGYNTDELQTWLASMGINAENVELFKEDEIPMACVVFASPEDAVQTKQKFHCHLRCGNALMEVYLLCDENTANVHGSVLQAMEHFIDCFGGGETAADNPMENGTGTDDDLPEQSQEMLETIHETGNDDEIAALNAEFGPDSDEIKLEPDADFE